MKFFRQLIPHTNLVKWEFDDCMRTSIGCFLEIPPEDVPQFMSDMGLNWESMVAFLRSYNAYLFTVKSNGTLEQVLDYMSTMNPDVYYMITGDDVYGDQRTVICLNSEIVWDTHQDDLTIVQPHNGSYIVHVLLNYDYHTADADEQNDEQEDEDCIGCTTHNSLGNAEGPIFEISSAGSDDTLSLPQG